MSDHKPDPLLEFRLLGEIPDALKTRAAENLNHPDAPDRLRELRESDRRILEEMPQDAMVSGIRRRLDAANRASVPRFGLPGWRAAIIPVLGLLVFALVVLPPSPETSAVPTTFDVTPTRRTAPDPIQPAGSIAPPTTTPRSSVATTSVPGDRVALAPPSDDGIRTKGDVPRLRVHLVDAPQLVATALRDGDTVASGAILQVSLLAGPSIWAAVVSIDSSGNVTHHLPEQGDSSILVEGAIQAPHSFQLDRAPGYERFVLLRSARPFALSEAGPSLRGTGSLQVVQSMHLVKREYQP